MTQPGLEVRNLSVDFRSDRVGRRSRVTRVVRDVSFDVAAGEVFGLVGESGSGKSTTARAILRLVPLAGGSILFDGVAVDSLKPRELREMRRAMQIVFQDPFSSMNPRMRVGDFVGEPLRVHEGASKSVAFGRAGELLKAVGLDAVMVERYPHELSGGQRQRAVIARALATRPSFLILDEAVSSLDVSIQAEILNLLADIRRAEKLTYLFISHDLAVVRLLADSVGVMYLGRLVERAPVETLFRNPRHPYTTMLMRSVLDIGVDLSDTMLASSEIESSAVILGGCEFRERCWLYRELGEPEVCQLSDPHKSVDDTLPAWSACHFSDHASIGPEELQVREKKRQMKSRGTA